MLKFSENIYILRNVSRISCRYFTKLILGKMAIKNRSVKFTDRFDISTMIFGEIARNYFWLCHNKQAYILLSDSAGNNIFFGQFYYIAINYNLSH